MDTPLYFLQEFCGNKVYIKRDDLIPFSFGGNKARKAELFFEEILRQNCDCVVTYGSSSSNHCRVVANMAAKHNLKCFIVSPEENYVQTFNTKLVKSFGASIVKCSLDKVSVTISNLMEELSKTCSPYFIQGGGHGNLGTQAYVNAYGEICRYEEQNGIFFDYIFLASGTGTTQAGLVCGAALKKHLSKKIVGISIARKNPRGAKVVEESVKDYLEAKGYEDDLPEIIFNDGYICGGYGEYNDEILLCIKELIEKHGIPANSTYTGKAFWGMRDYIVKNKISGKNVLFIHTGGAPLFFDDLKRIDE